MLRLLLGAFALLAFTAPAQAQLDLPKAGGRTKGGTEKPADQPKTPPRRGGARGKGGNVAPFLECSVCYERNYVTTIDATAKDGLQKAWCGVCQTPRLHRQPKVQEGGGAGLDLPSGSRGGQAGAGEGPEVAIEAPLRPAETSGGNVNLSLLREARKILDEVGRERRMDADVVLRAPDALLALGEGGLAAARVALASDHAPTMIVAERTLLRAGLGRDADHVLQRLKTRMPSRAAGAAVQELVARDPVRANPELLCRLLGHPQMPVRTAADRALAEREEGPDESWLPFLRDALDSDSGDSRLRAVGLLSQVEGSAALDLLLDQLDDPRAKVVSRVAQALARSDDSRVQAELLSLAFGDRWVLRSNACALLALVEREDLKFEPILNGDHVETLMRGLGSNDPFVSGVSAACLAGIGFRDTSVASPEYMTREVPERLVTIVAGIRFFDDHEAIQPVALRRLQLITGQTHGADGPAWANWWVDNGESFRASRAVLPVEAEDAQRLAAIWIDPEQGAGFQLLGPALMGQARTDGPPDVLYLHKDQATELFLRLQEEDVFGVERLPGPRGSRVGRARKLTVSIGEAKKSFQFGGMGDDWFERCGVTMQGLKDQNRWQRYPHPERHGSQEALVREHGEWWAQVSDPADRARALADLVLDWMAATPSGERETGLRELERLYGESEWKVATEGDFGRLLARLREETYFADRARRLVDLTLMSAGLGQRPEPGSSPGATELALGRELIGVLYNKFEFDAAESIGKALERLGQAEVLEAAKDSRPLLRAMAATFLAVEPNAVETEALIELINDPLIAVEVAAIAASGDGRVAATLPQLLQRAAVAEPDVRRVALEAIGKLGGTEAREVLLTTLTEPAGTFRTEAALGLAELGDPRVAGVLVGLLREGRNSETWLAARRGLLDLGVAAHDELYSALRSPETEVRRESALLLARQMVPTAANSLVRILTEDPTDQLAASELAILSCVDHRNAQRPADAWWAWWDGVTHDDALPWFLAAAEIRSLPAPQPIEEHFGAELSRDAWLFLAEVLRRPEPWLVERARREIERRSGAPVGEVPANPKDREAWIQALVEVLLDSGEE